MNDKVRELFERAIDKHKEECYFAGFSKDKVPSVLDIVYDMIIEECAEQVDKMWIHQKNFKGTLDIGKQLRSLKLVK